MGHNPVPPPSGITIDQAGYRLARGLGVDGERFHLGRARDAFVHGQIDVDEFERAVEHVLRGGYLGEHLELKARLMDNVRRRRQQLDCPHDDVYELRAMDGMISRICAQCGASDNHRVDVIEALQDPRWLHS